MNASTCAVVMWLSSKMGAVGARLMGVGSVSSRLVSATPSGPGAHATSPKSGSIRGGMGFGSMGTVLVAASPFGRVMVGLVGAQMSCKGVVGRKSLALGMGPIDSSMSVAQFNVEFVAQSAGGGTCADCAMSGGVKFGDTSTVQISHVIGFQWELKAGGRRSQYTFGAYSRTLQYQLYAAPSRHLLK
jgi:hypothetical protein